MIERINDAIDYIEENLIKNIDINEVSKVAYCSVYHFQRMFTFLVGIPVKEYIRRRRLTLAALDLQQTNDLIINIALRYGYTSPDSFTRAFYRLHGVTPRVARTKGVELKAYSPISFQITIKGDKEMNYRIEEKESFKVFGIERTVNATDGRCYNQIPKFWLESIENGMVDKLREVAGLSEDDLLNAAIGNHDENGNFNYMICANKDILQNDFTSLDIPKATWVVFKTDIHNSDETTKKVQNIWKRVFPEWFPTSGYEHANLPEFEMYFRSDDMFYAEVWVPIVKK